MNATSDLLRRYALSRDEEAFSQIVAHYFAFVHGVALRRFAGDATHALDVVQLVFTDLAFKAHKLRDDSQLGGWLHRHTCFVTSKFIRSEIRRAAREQHAAQMQTFEQSGDDSWTAIAPIIDEALHDLAEQDRSAILLRYFEGRDLRAIAETFRISDDAAQKRVQRALERLKSVLQQKGIAVSAIALAAAITANASPPITSAPVQEITAAATTKHAASSGLSRFFNAKVAIAAATVLVAILFLIRPLLPTTANQSNPPAEPTQQLIATKNPNVRDETPGANTQTPSLNDETSADALVPQKDTLLLRVIDASTKQPIPDAKAHISMGRPPQPATIFVDGDILIDADQNGIARIPLANTRPDRLMIRTYADRYADWISIWNKSKGEVVPQGFTIALEPGVPLGGHVLDQNGDPVASAEVRFGTRPRDGTMARSSQQSAVRPLTNITDSAGNWLDTHIPESFIDVLSLSISHPDFVKTNISPDSATIAALRSRSFTIALAKGINVFGRVTTSSGDPVTNAVVSYARPSYVYRLETRTDSEGRYTLKNISPEGLRFERVFAVVAPGYAVATQKFEPTENSAELNFVLQPGRIIRGRVVNADGEPLGNVRVIRNRDDGIDWYMITADDGRFFWNGAPDSPQNFYFGVPGYIEIRERFLTPQDEDYEIVLQKPQTLKGTVTDANTGEPIRFFYGARARTAANRAVRTDFSEYEFKNGSFEFPIGGDSTYNMIRLRAPGYLTALFPIPADNKITAQLKTSRALEGIILDSQGRPVAQAEVAAISDDSRQNIRLGKGRFVIDGIADHTRADQTGRFKLPLSSEPHALVAVHPAGMAEISLSDFESTNELRLLPWSRVEGILVSNNIPMADQQIVLQSSGAIQLDYRDFRNTMTATDGRFVIEQAPPRHLHIHHQPPFTPPPPGEVRFRRGPIPAQTNFLAAPGAVTYIELDAAKPPTFPTNAPTAPFAR